jgi:hypothetical protein
MMEVRGNCCIYGSLLDGQTYLIDGLFPQACRLPLSVGQDASAILAAMPPDTAWFSWHVFLTFKRNIPPHRDALAAGLRKRGIITINEGIVDGSKRYTQAVLSQAGLPTTIAASVGDPGELLFFKSNHNFGGIAERRLPQELREYFKVALPHPSAPLFRDYGVIARHAIPPSAFHLEDIVIERYVTNRSDLFYRAFVVFDAVVLSRLVCKGVIKKALEAEFREDYFFSFSDEAIGYSSAPDKTTQRVLSDVKRFCRAFELDVGAVDILLDEDGVPYIIDVNPTAFGGANLHRPGFLSHLLSGIQDHAAKASSRTP